MSDLFDLVSLHSGQVRNSILFVLGQENRNFCSDMYKAKAVYVLLFEFVYPLIC